MFGMTPWRKQGDGGQLATRSEFPLRRLRDEFDAMFNQFLGHWPSAFSGEWGAERGWGLDMEDTGQELVIRADAPGFEAGDFDVQVSGNTLTIRAERKHEEGKEKSEGYHYAERKLQRSVTLPAGVDSDKVDARYRNGVLELFLVKKPEAQAKRIEVKT